MKNYIDIVALAILHNIALNLKENIGFVETLTSAIIVPNKCHAMIVDLAKKKKVVNWNTFLIISMYCLCKILMIFLISFFFNSNLSFLFLWEYFFYFQIMCCFNKASSSSHVLHFHAPLLSTLYYAALKGRPVPQRNTILSITNHHTILF